MFFSLIPTGQDLEIMVQGYYTLQDINIICQGEQWNPSWSLPRDLMGKQM